MNEALKYKMEHGVRVVCAANRNQFGEIVLGARHHDSLMNVNIKRLDGYNKHAAFQCLTNHWEQGFIDQFGRFMNRKEAMVVALKANQVNIHSDKCPITDELFSENLY